MKAALRTLIAALLLSVACTAIAGLLDLELWVRTVVAFLSALGIGAHSLAKMKRKAPIQRGEGHIADAAVFAGLGLFALAGLAGEVDRMARGFYASEVTAGRLAFLGALALFAISLFFAAAIAFRTGAAPTRPRQRILRIAGFALLSFLMFAAISCIAYGLAGVYPFRYIHTEVDVHSGRLRVARLFLGVPVAHEIRETPVSRALGEDYLRGVQPEWHPVYQRWVQGSTHYAFHAAENDIHQLDMIWDLGQFTPEARNKSAKDLLYFWQRGRSYFLGTEYIVWIAESFGSEVTRSEREAKLNLLLKTPPEEMVTQSGEFRPPGREKAGGGGD